MATLRADPAIVRRLRAVLGTPMTVSPEVVDGRVEIEIRSYSAEMIAHQLAGFGASVEVLGPPEVRGHLRRIAAELTSVYRS